MSLKKIVLIATVLVVSIANAQVQPYKLFTSKGKEVSFEKMTKDLKQSDVVLFGELHNNAIAHYFQVKVAKTLYENKDKKLVIGAEMFERDQAEILQNYVKGNLDEKEFEKQMRLWNNYKTDYKPLLNFAKEHKINYVATNVPRRYASLLYKKGIGALDTLSVEEKSWIAPLPFPYDKNLPCYVKMMDMFKDSDHANENFPKSQAIKDATMAYFLLQNTQPNSLFLHLNGSYHSDNHEGIAWYINQYQKDILVKTITVVEQASVKNVEKEHLGKADFIIVVDADMPKSFE
ncbi:ChaN family lipoprotein [Flavobacterium sp. xlx-214]|uniref:ChaN family lipoprotein n=1 Tax=unclassified Flavobacterium TaxID=196869 RepID=UPI0013D0F4D5|nr:MULTISPECIES: ChaN family lipoprotein [unclassified Flavobacterium]MBA5793051.1 ChaN family lipoprotein [Flavobacterium sp. xlx-221]QMI84621.1 ChaN family lipoprotein [Flavobacterium sp. xlx-214]